MSLYTEDQIGAMLASQQDPEASRRMQEMHARELAVAEEQRRQLTRFAAVACGCSRRYDWGGPQPPQLECIIHGQLVISVQDGRVLG